MRCSSRLVRSTGKIPCTSYTPPATFTKPVLSVRHRELPFRQTRRTRSVKEQIEDYQYEKRYAQQPCQKIFAHDVLLSIKRPTGRFPKKWQVACHWAARD